MHRLGKSDQQATLTGIETALIGKIARSLTDIQTVTVQQKSGISDKAMNTVSSVVRSFQGFSPFAPYYLWKKIVKSVRTFLHFDTFCVSVEDPDKNGDSTDIELPFSYACVYEALDDHLTSLQTFPEVPAVGIDLGEEGLVVATILMGDKGGNTMSFIAEHHAFEDARQKHVTNIGEHAGKESHFVMENTVAPYYNDSIAKCNDSLVLVVEWPGGLDHIMIPKSAVTSSLNTTADRSKLPPEIALEVVGNKLQARWTGGEVFFRRVDIPATGYRVKCLPIVVLSTGDFAYLMMIYGREEFMSHKCFYCLLSRTHPTDDSCCWREQHHSLAGKLLTNDLVQREIDDYKLAHTVLEDLEEEMTLDLLAECWLRSEEANAISGITNRGILFPGILLERIPPPPLHITLGAMNYLDRHIIDFIRGEVEPDLPYIADARAALKAAQDELEALEAEKKG